MSNAAYPKYFKFIEWILFFGLCALSGIFMGGVLDKFFSRKTSFTQSEEPIKEYPTLMICLVKPESRKTEYEYDSDFRIEYETPHSISPTVLKEGAKTNIYRGISYLNKIQTYKMGNCYKITTVLNTENMLNHWKKFFFNFNETIKDDLPSVNIYVTSENNAYGVVANTWMDGK